MICGLDEVGRGPLAGPVVAAAVVLRRPVVGIADSKVLTALRREHVLPLIREAAWVGVGAASAREIDRINILQAGFLAMRRALARLPVIPELLLVDGSQDPRLGLPTRCIVGGDASEATIGAASIVAKVLRDALMAKLALRHQGYGFERNVGYPTPEHRAALLRLGPTPHHRMSFAPLRLLSAA